MKRAGAYSARHIQNKTGRWTLYLSALLCLTLIFSGCDGNTNGSSSTPVFSDYTSSEASSDSADSSDSLVSEPTNTPSSGIVSSKQVINNYGKEILAPITFLILDNRDMPLVNARVQIEDFPYSGVTTYEGKVTFSYSPDSGSTPLCEGDYTLRIEQDTLLEEPQVDILEFSLNQRSPDMGVTLQIDSERTHDLLLSSTIRIEFLARYTSGPPVKNLQVVLECDGSCHGGDDEQGKKFNGFSDELGKLAFVGVDSSHRYNLSFLWYGGNPISLSYTTPSGETGEVVMTLADDGWYVGQVPMSKLNISKEELDDVVKVGISIRQLKRS